ncbi:MAG TPA: hypothetical protein VI365_28435 [Trebonia sp.]
MNDTSQPRKPSAEASHELVKPAPAQPATPAPSAAIGEAEPGPVTQPRSDLAAAVLAERARWRARGRLHAALRKVARSRRFPRRAALDALAAEDEHLGAARDPVRKTHGESLVQALGKHAADGALSRSQRGLDRRAARADRLREKQARLHVRAGHRAGDRVRHPDGGRDTAERLDQAGTALRAQIAAEILDGSRRHVRLPKWIRHIPKLVLAVDFTLLLYFFAGITDVDWASPLSAYLGFAILLAAMVTMLSYGFLAFTGYRLRTYKDHSGAIAYRDLDGLTRVACGSATCGAVMIAVLMFIRMRVEVLDALGPAGWVTADTIALVLAAVSAMANFLVAAIHALDGSDEVARLDALCASASRPLGKAHRLREKATAITYRVAVQQRRADRQAIKAVTRAGRHLAVADQIIEAARTVHQGTGPHACPATDPNQHAQVAGYLDDDTRPMADLRPLRTAVEHINSPLPAAQQVGEPGQALLPVTQIC